MQGIIKPCNILSRCAGKMLHDVFRTADSEQKQAIVDRFEQECEWLGRIRHPNIVLFLGVYFKPGDELPILVMELLPLCLTKCLEKYPNIPSYVKNSILLDVAEGLHYLHSQDPALIHRDLTANNILLTNSMQAKIADLGVAKILNPGQITTPLTAIPGTACYMPPEAFINSTGGEPRYSTKLDIFSFGNVILHVVNQKWPFPTNEMLETLHPSIVQQIPEVKRRASHLDEMGEDHSLRIFTTHCLDNSPQNRPTASEAVSYLRDIISRDPCPFPNALDILQAVSAKSGEIQRLERQVYEGNMKEHDLVEAKSALGTQVEGLVGRLSAEEEELKGVRELLHLRQREVAGKGEELTLKDSLLQTSKRKVEALEMEVEALRRTHL